MTAEQRRSEVVRARRNKRTNTTQSRRSARTNNDRAFPPMVSRRGMSLPAASPPKRGQRKSQRRKISVPIGPRGAEIKLPGVALPQVGWRAASLILLVIFSLAIYWLNTSPAYSVTPDRVVVHGLSRVEKASLLEASGILNRPVFKVDPGKLSEKLPVIAPALESAKVSVAMDGTILIEVVEGSPVLAWDQGEINQVSWVDLNGRIFPAIGSSENLVYVQADDVPPSPATKPAKDDPNRPAGPEDEAQAEEQPDNQLLSPELVANILVLSQMVPEGSQLIYDGDQGFGWQDPEFGWMVYFGKQLDQPELRLKIYQAIVAMFADKQRKPVMISVEFIHAPYYRMEE